MPDISDTAYSEVDASNTAAPPNGWPEGMMPAGVNDTARQNMAALKRFWNRVNGVRTTTGAPPYYQLATDNVTYPTAYVSGELWAFKAHRASGGGDALQINSLGPKNIYHLAPSVAQISAGEIPAGQVVVVAYDATLSAGAGGWQLLASGAADKVSRSGDTMSGALTINAASGFALNMPSGGIVAGDIIQTSSFSSNAFYVPNGGTVIGGTLVVNGSGVGAVTFNGSGGDVLRVPNGSIYAGGSILVQGNMTAGGDGLKPGGGPWTALSDSLVKKDVADYGVGLDAVLRLTPRSYKYNGRGGTHDDGRVFVGLVADEVLPVMPEMVGTSEQILDPGDTSPTAIQTLDTNALLYAMLNSIKELSARLAALETPF